METVEKQAKNTESGTKTIGDVKAQKPLWGRIVAYKNDQEINHGRKLKMPEALLELAEKGLDSIGS